MKKISPAPFRFRKLRREALPGVKSTVLAVTVVLLFSSCRWFGEPEQYKTESGRTTYRSAEQSPPGAMTPAPQKIPGESRKP